MLNRAYFTDDAVKMQVGIALLLSSAVFLSRKNRFTWRLDTVNFGRYQFGGVF
jgi:hypothetical protein